MGKQPRGRSWFCFSRHSTTDPRAEEKTRRENLRDSTEKVCAAMQGVGQENLPRIRARSGDKAEVSPTLHRADKSRCEWTEK